ncbi:phenylacetate--CoA ligase family protein [Antrihabitans stalactiti]|uniref:Phenylacetate-CoA ligase n=1 Tax=Antrihabitans stalactiti TaxID=2584121 RepID=A0A848KEE7_9NOCA|nr:hypothetical protein [Antrihabitans stalactiti]NMN95092.1 hypothetical protein [Antrihabitans stalactiti]
MTKPDVMANWPLHEVVSDQGHDPAAMLVASSGSSGQPTFWARGTTSFAKAEDHFDRLFRTQFQTQQRRTLVVVCFAMGTWTGGTYTLLAMLGLRSRGHLITVITPGVDLRAVQDVLADLGPMFDRIVLAGYPPYVRDVLDQAPEAALAQDIWLLVGGEPMSEDWRDYVLNRLKRVHEPARVVSVYGSSEIGFVGNETALTIAARRAAQKDSALSTALFGGQHPASFIVTDTEAIQPTLIEYDPHLCYVETDENGYLLFTVDGTIPMVRYRVNDQGRLICGQELFTLLRATGNTRLADMVDTSAWYLVMYGRTDVAAIFCSANIYPDPIRTVVDDPTFSETVTGKFLVTVTHDANQREQLHLRVELRRDAVYDEQLADHLAKSVVDRLVRTNSEYRVLREKLGSFTDPIVVFEQYGSEAFIPGAKQRRVAPADPTPSVAST